MKRALTVLVAVAWAAAVPVLAQTATPTKIAVFDAGRVSEETEEGKKISARLNDLQEKKRAELAAKEKAVADLQNQLQNQGLSLSSDKRNQMEKDAQKALLELNQAREAARNELQMELQEAQGKFQGQLLQVVEQFARTEGFDLIFEKGQAVFASSSVDVTTAIVDLFNKLAAAAPPEKAADKPAEKAADKPAPKPAPVPPKKN